MWKWLSRIVVTLALLILAVRLGDTLVRRGNAVPPPPNPNAYETLLAVAQSVTPPTGDVADLPADTVLRLAQTNREALSRLHTALRADSGVPIQTQRGWPEQHAEDLRNLKRLAVVLAIQARADSLAGRTNDAPGHLLDVILLGQALGRGGILVDGLTGLAVETVGTASLRSQVPSMDAAACRQAARDLENAEKKRSAPGLILRNEKAWSDASFGIVSRLGGYLQRKANAQRATQFTTRSFETARNTRKLILLLGARAMELETGKPLSNAAALVPGVLQAIPLDPETNTPITGIPPGNTAP